MKQSIGSIICESRQNRKMTQREFASRLGVTEQAVSKWERGSGLPDISLVEGICDILGISPNILFGVAQNKLAEGNNPMGEQALKGNMFAEPLVLEFGKCMISCMAAGLQTDLINRKRIELLKRTGILMPILRVRDNLELAEKEVRILSYDKVLWSRILEETDEITYENTYSQVIEQVALQCQQHYASILNKHLVKIMMDNVKETYPGMIDGLIPERISYLQILRKLQEILHEKGEIRDMVHILEELESELMWHG